MGVVGWLAMAGAAEDRPAWAPSVDTLTQSSDGCGSPSASAGTGTNGGDTG